VALQSVGRRANFPQIVEGSHDGVGCDGRHGDDSDVFHFAYNLKLLVETSERIWSALVSTHTHTHTTSPPNLLLLTFI
jgi:hypothetical protein